jgi:hypothetical protein
MWKQITEDAGVKNEGHIHEIMEPEIHLDHQVIKSVVRHLEVTEIDIERMNPRTMVPQGTMHPMELKEVMERETMHIEKMVLKWAMVLKETTHPEMIGAKEVLEQEAMRLEKMEPNEAMALEAMNLEKMDTNEAMALEAMNLEKMAPKGAMALEIMDPEMIGVSEAMGLEIMLPERIQNNEASEQETVHLKMMGLKETITRQEIMQIEMIGGEHQEAVLVNIAIRPIFKGDVMVTQLQ